MNPLHKRLSLIGQNVFVKENYMLSRELVTAFTWIILEKPCRLLPEFVFKEKGTRAKLNSPPMLQWAEKCCYR